MKSIVTAAFIASAVLVAQEAFTAARLESGTVPAQPRQVLGGGQVLIEVTVSRGGQVSQLANLRTTPPFTDLVLDVVRGWTFRPAEQAQEDGTVDAVESKVLVAAMFRPPTLLNTPGVGEVPRDVGSPSEEVPFPTAIAEPFYPPGALGERVVLLEVEVRADGTVRGLRVVRSGAGFDQTATDALAQWRFRPARRNGEAIAAFAYVIFGFQQPVTTPPRPGDI